VYQLARHLLFLFCALTCSHSLTVALSLSEAGKREMMPSGNCEPNARWSSASLLQGRMALPPSLAVQDLMPSMSMEKVMRQEGPRGVAMG